MAARGWARHDATRVLVHPRLEALAPMDPPAGLCAQATGADDYALAVGLLRGSSMAEIAAHAQRLRASSVPYRGCVWRQGAQSEVVACAQVARDGELAGLYDVCTAPAARGRGLATALCASVLREAHEAGARSVAMTIPESKGAVYFETRSPPFRVRLDANEAIRAWAAKQPAHQVHFVDASALVPYSGTNGLWEPDGLHLSQRGYEAFGRALAPQIADFVRATRGAPNMAPMPAGPSAASAADADAEPGWYPGARVSIFGLTKAAQHNGKYGRLSARAPPSGGGEGRRLGVELEEGGTVISVRCENLVLAPVPVEGL